MHCIFLDLKAIRFPWFIVTGIRLVTGDRICTRAVIISCQGIKIISASIRTAKYFQFIAHAIGVVIAYTFTVAIVIRLCIIAHTVIR